MEFIARWINSKDGWIDEYESIVSLNREKEKE